MCPAPLVQGSERPERPGRAETAGGPPPRFPVSAQSDMVPPQRSGVDEPTGWVWVPFWFVPCLIAPKRENGVVVRPSPHDAYNRVVAFPFDLGIEEVPVDESVIGAGLEQEEGE